MEALEHAVGFVRTELAKRLRTYHTPEIQFRLDTSIERGTRVLQLLRELGLSEGGGKGEGGGG
jgi:ribosome-binding factor A